RLALALARDTGAALYLTHVSTAEEIELIKKFRKTAKVYCEITPHHLLLDESIMKNIGNIGKINPPLRPCRDNRALYEAIYDGTADTIGSDHAPHSLEEKALPYEKAPSGFPGLETTLALLTNEVNEKRLELETVSRLTAERPAQIFGFDRRGEIREGYFADIALVDMNRNWRIDAKRFRSKAKFSPFDGLEVKGKNVLTVINGKICYRENSSE
ncbi:MAG: Dihydroorotase, partial [uncultured bacterium]